MKKSNQSVQTKTKASLPSAVKRELFFYTKPEFKRNGELRRKRKTIAAVYLEDGRLLFGKSECSFNDQFSKSKGRNIAKARAMSQSKVTLKQALVIDPMRLTEEFLEIAQTL